MANIYSVDPQKKVDAKMVRDAIVKCFLKAHSEVLDEMKTYAKLDKKELQRMKEIDVELLIKTFFTDVGGDFMNPTKEHLLKVMQKLKDYAKNFRNQKIIDKHASQIMVLMDKL